MWYDGVPPGHQPAPTSCYEAERIAARDRNARVIYGRGREGRGDDRYERDDRYGRAIPRDDRYPGGSPYPDPDSRRYPDSRYPARYPDSTYPGQYPDRRGGYGTESVPYDNGYQDGLVKGREDERRNRSYDPARHSWYRSGDRGYNRRFGSRDEYRATYRDGFLAGYQNEYRANTGTTNRSRRPSWWPF
ncbi:MAG: hypothetical protein LC804_08740 [Acidobacteria bacterium]|nr:hypothetical protein [Acidobacteriota bacterium]